MLREATRGPVLAQVVAGLLTLGPATGKRFPLDNLPGPSLELAPLGVASRCSRIASPAPARR